MTHTGRYPHRRRTHCRIALLLAWLGGWAAPAFSQTPAGATDAALRLEQVEFVDSGHAKLVTLQFSHTPAALKAFALNSPPRVVIDVEGSPRASASATYAAQDSLIQRVRVGYHEQYIRFVLDLKEDVFIPPFSVDQQQATVIASLQVLGQTAATGNRDNKLSPKDITIPFADARSQVLFSRSGSTAMARGLDRPSQTAQTERATPAAAPAAPQPVVQTARTPEPPAPRAQPVAARSGSAFVPARRPSVPDEESPGLLRSGGRHGQDAPAPPRSFASVPVHGPFPAAGAALVHPAEPVRRGPRERKSVISRPLRRDPVCAVTLGRWPPSLPAMRCAAAVQKKRRPRPACPRRPGVIWEKGQILYDQGKLAEAITEWRETARLAPNHAKAHHLLGLALQDQGNTEEAISELQTSVRLDPENATAYVHLAQALESKGDSQGALSAYNKALELVPTSAHVHNRLGHLLAAQGDWQGAVKEWQQTTELQPDYSYAYANLGEALEQIEKKKEALEAYQQAVLLDPAAPFASEVRQRIVRLSTDDL